MVKRVLMVLSLLMTAHFVYPQKQGANKIDSLLYLLKEYKSACNENCLNDSAKVKYFNSIAIEYRYVIPDSAIEFSTKALILSEKIKWQKGIGQSNNQLGVFSQEQGDYSKALAYDIKALKVWEEMEKNAPKEQMPFILNRKAAAFANIGAVYVSQGLTIQAKAYCFQALNLFEKLGDKNSVGAQLNNIGNIEKNTGSFPAALSCYLKALKIFEEVESEIGIANSFFNIGRIHRKLGNSEKAIDYYLRSINIAEQNDFYTLIATSLSDIGATYFERNVFDSTLTYAYKALDIFKQVNNLSGIADQFTLIGSVYKEQKKNAMAEEYFKRALSVYEEEEDKINTSILLGNIGQVYAAEKKYGEAKIVYLKSIKIAEEINSWDDIRQGNENLSNLSKQTGNYKEALEYYRRAVNAKDSLFSTDKTEEITRLEMTFEQEKKDAISKAEQEKKDVAKNAEIEKQKPFRNSIAGGSGIILLSALLSFFFYKRKRDAEQKQKEMALSLQVSETEMKALRSQMNPHFIFNALQSIQTFLMSHQPDDANTYLLKFSKLMRLVLENSQHREVSLEKDMQALELYMQLESIRLAHPFTYAFHIDEAIDVEETTIPPLILQPFVENAIWHGLQYKTEPGHINIYISKKDNELHAIVEDNGVGRDMSKQSQQPMLMPKEPLGMKLTQERLKILNELKKIKAQFKITDLFTNENAPSGTRVELSLPLGN